MISSIIIVKEERVMRSHVGIPNCLLKSYSSSNHVWVYDYSINKVFQSENKKAGTINNYYSKEIEAMLSNELEGSLGNLLNIINKCKNMKDKTNYLNSNHEVLESFIKYQFQRSRRNLELFNSRSLTSEVFGQINHSEYLLLVSKVENINLLQLFNGPIWAKICIAKGTEGFITNSLGFYFVINKNKNIDAFIIPISFHTSIYISRVDERYRYVSHFIAYDDEVNYLNKNCVIFEKVNGNGQLYSTQKKMLECYI